MNNSAIKGERPYSLIAELTYRCPLRCVYCSNPIDIYRRRSEIDTQTWKRVLTEAEALGVVQVSFSGGEPLLRDDVEELIAHARDLNLYSNLVTSAIPHAITRLPQLKAAGIDAIQVSIQDSDIEGGRAIAGGSFHSAKLEFAHAVKALGLPLTVNVVLHRQNLERLEAIIALAEQLRADRLELANTQYQGWAMLNRTLLLPTREQLQRARECALLAKQRLQGRMEMLFVMPDYYSDRPKPCMGGWGRRFILVTPEGQAQPCHAAQTLPNIELINVRDHSLEWIWHESSAFNLFRGEAWMPEPCRSCNRRAIDFGGCRCQAYALTGDAIQADPSCGIAPAHNTILAARMEADNCAPPNTPLTVTAGFQYRTMRSPPNISRKVT